MTAQTRKEVIKAIARGNSPEKASELIGVTVDEAKSVTQDEIDKGKENLWKWGRL